MKEAIAVLGLPASGKSTLIGPYQDRIVHVGGYAHSLPEEHPLKKQCIAHWQANTTFNPELLDGLLSSYPMPKQDWFIIDGTPREIEGFHVVERYFDLRALVEITINEDVWMKRAFSVSENGREHRYDSSLPQLLKRREVYKEKMGRLRHCFTQQHILDNSGSIEETRERFAEIISEIFPQKG